jgi:hypothetical protein
MTKTPKRPNSVAPGKCIFCGGEGLTKEHLWAEWIQHYIPKDSARSAHRVDIETASRQTPLKHPEFDQDRFEANSIRGKLDNVGDPLTRKLHVVCGACNSGWMSLLQRRTKPILSRMLQGKWMPLNEYEQLTLAAWAVMYTMVVEFAYPETHAVSFQQRSIFRQTQRPPPNWYVWIAPMQSKKWNKRFHHTGSGLFLSPEPNRIPPCNIQVTTFGIGQVLFNTLMWDCSSATIKLSGAYAAGTGLNAIWPFENIIPSKPARILETHDADYVAVVLRDIFARAFASGIDRRVGI